MCWRGCGALHSFFVLVETVENQSHHWNSAQSQQTRDDDYSQWTWFLIWTTGEVMNKFRMIKPTWSLHKRGVLCATYSSFGAECCCHFHQDQLTFFHNVSGIPDHIDRWKTKVTSRINVIPVQSKTVMCLESWKSNSEIHSKCSKKTQKTSYLDTRFQQV